MKQVAIGEVTAGPGCPLLVIAGPCAAESEQLCLEVADALQRACAKAGAGYVFKASFDKANRTARSAARGPGPKAGLSYLQTVRERLQIPVITDIHLPEQAAPVAKVCDALQIPAFLCRQSDLLAAAAATGRPVMAKKGQFLAPQDMTAVAEKLSAGGAGGVLLCERGTTFGYHNLVVDMRGLVQMRATGWPVVFDATHSTQLPGAAGDASSGQREFAAPLARAACAVGIDGLFMEVHRAPAEAISDAAVQLDIDAACALIDHAVTLAKLGRAA